MGVTKLFTHSESAKARIAAAMREIRALGSKGLLRPEEQTHFELFRSKRIEPLVLISEVALEMLEAAASKAA